MVKVIASNYDSFGVPGIELSDFMNLLGVVGESSDSEASGFVPDIGTSENPKPPKHKACMLLKKMLMLADYYRIAVPAEEEEGMGAEGPKETPVRWFLNPLETSIFRPRQSKK